MVASGNTEKVLDTLATSFVVVLINTESSIHRIR